MNREELIRHVSDGFDRAKAGQAAQVYAEVSPYHDSGELDRKSHYPFGWIIYYALHQAPDYAIGERKRMLARYLNLEVTKPHKLHSMILTEAIRLAKDAEEARFVARQLRESGSQAKTDSFSIVNFSKLWNLAHLRDGDWRRKEHEGKPMNSTVEKFITAYVNELEEKRMVAPEEFKAIIGRASEEFSDSASFMAQMAVLNELDGNREEAVGLLKKAVISAPSKFFLWQRLARLVDPGKEAKLHIALLYKALQSPGQEEYKGKIRLALAEAWLGINAPAQAAWELQKIKELYTRNGWHLSPRFLEAEKKIPAGLAPVDPAKAYRSVEPLAEEFIYDALEELPVKKTYHKEAGESTDRYGNKRRNPIAWRVTDEAGNNYWLTPSRLGIDETLPHSTSLLVKLHNGKVVKARLAD